MILYTLLTTLILVTAAENNYNCIQDADCANYSLLHNFTCLETECEQKRCDCPVGKIIYSDNSTGTVNYHCVKHIPVGEACTTSNPLTGSCNINRNFICTNNKCGCAASWQLYRYTHWHYDIVEQCMLGNKFPAGEIRFIGARCSADSDCSFFDNVTCVDNRCTCSISGHVPNIYGTECKFPIQYGESCTSNDASSQHCDGTKGLVCGNVCNISYSASTCQCDPSYRRSGSSCIRAEVGTSCNRDYQCKSLSRVATCMEGSCLIAPGTGCRVDHDCIWVSPTAVCELNGLYGTCQLGDNNHGGATRLWIDVVMCLAFILIQFLVC